MRYCGADYYYAQSAAVTAFDRAHPAVKARFVYYDPSGDDWLEQMHKAVASGRCDVAMDFDNSVADLAARNRLRDLTAYMHPRRGEFFPVTLAQATYAGRTWAVPRSVTVRMLVYRGGRMPLRDWRDVYAYAGVVRTDRDALDAFLELSHAEGGRILNASGTDSLLDTPPNRRALARLRDATSSGRLLREPHNEGQASAAWTEFTSGSGRLMASWSERTKGFRDASSIGIAVLPGSMAAGQVVVVSRRSRNPRAALALVDFLTRAPSLREQAVLGGSSPLRASYRDPRVLRNRTATAVGHALEHAITEPVTPSHDWVVWIIEKHVRAALAGRETTGEALARADAEIYEQLPSSVSGAKQS